MGDNTMNRQGGTSWVGLIGRFVIAAIVLWVTAILTPGYSIVGFWTPLIQAVVIVALDYVIRALTGIDASPFGRGFIGFIVSAVIIYLTQYVIPGVSVTVLGALIASLIIGIIEAILPVKVI